MKAFLSVCLALLLVFLGQRPAWADEFVHETPVPLYFKEYAPTTNTYVKHGPVGSIGCVSENRDEDGGQTFIGIHGEIDISDTGLQMWGDEDSYIPKKTKGLATGFWRIQYHSDNQIYPYFEPRELGVGSWLWRDQKMSWFRSVKVLQGTSPTYVAKVRLTFTTKALPVPNQERRSFDRTTGSFLRHTVESDKPHLDYNNWINIRCIDLGDTENNKFQTSIEGLMQLFKRGFFPIIRWLEKDPCPAC